MVEDGVDGGPGALDEPGLADLVFEIAVWVEAVWRVFVLVE